MQLGAREPRPPLARQPAAVWLPIAFWVWKALRLRLGCRGIGGSSVSEGWRSCGVSVTSILQPLVMSHIG